MNLILIPIFGTSGFGVGKENHSYINTKSQICIPERAFPHREDHQFIKLSYNDKPLIIGGIETRLLTGGLHRIVHHDNGKYSEEEIKKDGYGNQISYLTAGELKSLGFGPPPFIQQAVLEEIYSIKYLESLPDELLIITMAYM